MKFYFGIQSRRLTLWKQYLLSIALTMGTSSTTQVVVWIILLCNTKKVNYIGHQISTPYVVPIPLRLNQFIAKDSPTLDLTDHFIKYNTAIQERKRKKLCFMSKQHTLCRFILWQITSNITSRTSNPAFSWFHRRHPYQLYIREEFGHKHPASHSLAGPNLTICGYIRRCLSHLASVFMRAISKSVTTLIQVELIRQS